MKVKAYGKINLSLDIVGIDSRGYHLLEMVMQNIDLYDDIEVVKKQRGIFIHGSNNIPLNSNNLAYKAAQMLIDKYKLNFGVDIKIKKNIPVAAGLAGGSADAAAVLKAVKSLSEIEIPEEELLEIGLGLGADVSYCIKGGTALCEGIGEKITTLPNFKDKIVVLIKPQFGLSTKRVYSQFDKMNVNVHVNTREVLDAISENDIHKLCSNMANVLEVPSLAMKPVLTNIKARMVSMGAINSMMSGSGPTIFGFFDDMNTAKQCAYAFKKTYKEVFITKTI